MKEGAKIQHVFWTGGLDSSCRVIHLLYNTPNLVQPHYVVRSEYSTGHEIDSMNKIREALETKYPGMRGRLLPTMYVNEDLIPRSGDIAIEIGKLKQKVKVHEQLHILADYCVAEHIEHIDITYERDEQRQSGEQKVAQYFEVEKPFKCFHNPHAELTKRSCYDMAVQEGWEDLLKLTSFCRRPQKNGKPCGICGPCCDAVKEGMGFRLPFLPRMKARILIPFRQFYRKNYLKHDQSWFFKMIRRRLEHKL